MKTGGGGGTPRGGWGGGGRGGRASTNTPGTHGAVPRETGSVANACGACHRKNAALFANTRMKHAFEDVGLPGCATCHSNHKIVMPSDEMLGMTAGSVCARCHGREEAKRKYGAALAHINTKGIIGGA